MSYLGNSPPSQNFVAGADQFSGTGSQTAFTLSRNVNTVFDIFVTVSNVPQDPFTAYTVSGNTLTFDGAPPSGTNNIDVVYRATNVQTFVPSPGVSQQFAIGTASAPAITFIGDTNTGIYSPAADTIAFTEGGTEVARFNSAGNFGVGTSSPSVATNYKGIVIQGSTTSAGGVLQLQTSDSSYQAQFYTDSNGTTISSTGNYPMRFQTNGTLQAAITSAGLFQFNSGYGSVATAYGCRAWVNFNGTGTVAIRASGNVSSITDNAVGDYTVNMTSAMPDANYSVVTTAVAFGTVNFQSPLVGASQFSGSFRVYTSNGTTQTDTDTICAAVFR